MSAEPGRVGRRRSTTGDHITSVALELFAEHGFDDVSVDDVARAAGIARRTLFRYYPSKNAIPWGDFDAHLDHMRGLLQTVPSDAAISVALRSAMLAFNSFDEAETAHHRQRMRVILETAALQAHSMTMYAGWRAVVAEFVAQRLELRSGDLIPQTTAWTMLGVALSAYEYWLDHEAVPLRQALGDAFDAVSAGLAELDAAAAPPRSAVIAYLVVSPARQAIDWYGAAFGAVLAGDPIMMDDGRVGHAELSIAGGVIYLADEFPEMGLKAPARQSVSVSLMLHVADTDAALERARARGADVERDVFEGHGSRNATVIDPFGHRWMLSGPVAGDFGAATGGERR